MENKDIVYIARTFGFKSAESFESFLKGESDVQLGTTRGEVVVSEKVEGLDLSKAISPVEVVKWTENAKKTEEINSYFFVSDSIDEIAKNISILNKEPVDESAYEKIEKNKNQNRFDYLGNGKVSMCVIAVDSEYLDELISQGYGEKRVGTYGTNLEKIQMNEVVLGDDGLKKLLRDGDSSEIVVYDEIHKAMDFVGFDYDKEGLFDNDYVPEVVVKDNEVVENLSEEETENDYKKDKITEARNQIDDMLSNGLISQEEYDLLLSAWADIPTDDANPDDGMDTDN